jgi:DNA-binding transcriptional MerR regulator
MSRVISIGAAAKLLGVSVDTLRLWDRRGIFSARKSPTGRREYLLEDVQRRAATPRRPSAPPTPT